jgi:mRNA interferase MazF
MASNVSALSSVVANGHQAIHFADTDCAILTVVFHSTALRGSPFEAKVEVSFLKDGAFIAQSIATYPTTRAIRRLGVLQHPQFSAVEAAVFKWLGKSSSGR